jgi:hypothetical protein
VLKFHPGEGKKKVDGSSAASHHRQMAITVVKPHQSGLWKNAEEVSLTTSVKNRLVVLVRWLLLKDKEANLFSHCSLRKQFYDWKKTLESTGEGVHGGIGGPDADNKIGKYAAGGSKSCLHIIEECNKEFPWYETLKDLYLDHPVLDNSAVLNSQSARGLSFASTPGYDPDDSSFDASDGNASDQEVVGGEQEVMEEEAEEYDMEEAGNEEEKEKERDKKDKKKNGDQKAKGRKFVKESDDESADDEPPRKKTKKTEEKVSNHYEKYDLTHLSNR